MNKSIQSAWRCRNRFLPWPTFWGKAGSAVASALVLSACTIAPPEVTPPDIDPPQWYAPTLPHQGRVEDLVNWWERLQEPVLVQWIAAAQHLSPGIASARAQVFAARANEAVAQDALFPRVGAVASAERTSGQLPVQRISDNARIGLQASWEVGVWGQATEGLKQTEANLQAAQAGWHEARVLVAVEVARLFYAQRACLQRLAIVAADGVSREKTLHAIELLVKAGFRAQADLALAQASVAQGKRGYVELRALCDNQVKAAVALTGIAEPQLRLQIQQLQKQANPQLPDNLLAVPALPGTVLAQRPDVYKAQREWVSAAANVSLAQADLLPSVSFSAYFFKNRVDTGISSNFNTWSFGPLQVSLPLLGRSGLKAKEKAAYVRMEAAAKNYESTVRQAVRSIEQALVDLDQVRASHTHLMNEAKGYTLVFQTLLERDRANLASLLDVEEARRLKLQADSAVVQAEYAQMNAWIALYQGLGGGFESSENKEVLNAN